VAVDIGAWLRIGFDTQLGLFHSTGVLLNRILDKELVSLCSRCSYKCTSRLIVLLGWVGCVGWLVWFVWWLVGWLFGLLQ
jgi:hypothetical protein